MNQRVYQLTPEQYQALQQKVEAEGFPAPPDPNNWTETAKGIVLSGLYADGHLTITIVSHPWKIPVFEIWDKIESWIPS